MDPPEVKEIPRSDPLVQPACGLDPPKFSQQHTDRQQPIVNKPHGKGTGPRGPCIVGLRWEITQSYNPILLREGGSEF